MVSAVHAAEQQVEGWRPKRTNQLPTIHHEPAMFFGAERRPPADPSTALLNPQEGSEPEPAVPPLILRILIGRAIQLPAITLAIALTALRVVLQEAEKGVGEPLTVACCLVGIF